MIKNKLMTQSGQPHRKEVEAQSNSLLRPTLFRAIFLSIFFTLGLLVVNVTIDASHRKFFPGAIQGKFDYFEAHKDEFDVIFIGSSLVQRHIDPLVFDEELMRAGYSVNSFNFAFLGMGNFQSDLLAQRILSLQPKRLKWIVIDAGIRGFEFAPLERYTNQALWWHTPKQTAVVIRAINARNLPIRQKLALSGEHLGHFLVQFMHLGMGPRYTKRTFHDLRKPVSSSEIADIPLRGFVPYRSSRQFLLRRTYERQVREAVVQGKWPDTIADIHLRYFLDQVKWFRMKGVEPVYIIPPMSFNVGDIRDPEGTIHVFRYNDPVKYPQLYLFESRRDGIHLLAPAARDYTRLFAREFVEVFGKRSIREEL